jgi:hypothetical protein
VAALLSQAIRHAAGGGPAALVEANGQQLAAALERAGWRVVRDRQTSRQLTL